MKIIIYVLLSGDGYGHDSVDGATLDKAIADEWDQDCCHWVEAFSENVTIVVNR